MVPTELVHPDVLTLAELLRADWPAARERIRLTGHPTCEGDDDADNDDEDDKTKDDDAGKDTNDDKDDDQTKDTGDADDDADRVNKDDDWKTKARKNETRAKRAERERQQATKERDELAAKLAKIEKSNLSEKEKEIATAREEATAAVTTQYETQQRADRIENAVTKLSLKGFKAKDSDGKEITLRFADPDDAQLRLDRALRNEEITYDEIYANGKPQAAAIQTFLSDLLEEHPRLRAEDSNGGGGKAEDVDFDAGKGKAGGGAKDLEEMSPDEHYEQIHGKS